MFSSADYVGKDLLFKDSTQCLISIETDNYKDFLGAYFDSMEGLNACAPSGESGNRYFDGLNDYSTEDIWHESQVTRFICPDTKLRLLSDL